MDDQPSSLDDYQDYFENRDWGQPIDAARFAYFDTLRGRFPIAEGQRILEIGFGDAGFLAWCARNGLPAAGVEILEAAVAKARALGHEAILGPLTEATFPLDRQFDVIVAIDVIEHLSVGEIRRFFATSLKHLAPAGRYLLRFPNGASPFFGLVQYGDLTHRTVLTPELLKEIVRPVGLIVTRSFNDRLLPKGSPLRRRITFALRSVIETIVGYAYFGGRVPLDPNIYAVVARPVAGDVEPV